MAECIGLEGGGADAAFGDVELNANPCEFSFKLPFSFSISIPIPVLPIPDLSLLIPKFSLSLNCDFGNPIDVSAGLPDGGGRIACFDPDPDKEEEAA